MDGGLQQTITLEKAFSDAPNVFNEVRSTGGLPRNDRTPREFTLMSLDENTKYFLRLRADNSFAGVTGAVSKVLEINTPG